jgi:hypothetical protein
LLEKEKFGIFSEIEAFGKCSTIKSRVEYYNKLDDGFSTSSEAVENKGFSRKGHTTSYYLDLKFLIRNFPETVEFDYVFGDVTAIPETPSFVKSRPINNINKNSILLKLDSARHYYVYPDKKNYAEKLNLIVWRGAAHQPHRKNFVKKYYDHPSCDIGCVHKKSENKPWHRPFMSISEQLNYKFILSIEGNDVATNLKWIMASNSLCFMTKPKYETWFMEGTLKPGYHYVELADDYSDLEEKIAYYLHDSDEAKRIINNANNYVKPFLNYKQEHLIGLLVMQKYFEKTGQVESLK